jgi:uncharacterized membrane protein
LHCWIFILSSTKSTKYRNKDLNHQQDQSSSCYISNPKYIYTNKEIEMFSLTPDGENSSGAKSVSSAKYKFFAKMTVYFVAIRAAHVYFTPSGGESSTSTAATSK